MSTPITIGLPRGAWKAVIAGLETAADYYADPGSCSSCQQAGTLCDDHRRDHHRVSRWRELHDHILQTIVGHGRDEPDCCGMPRDSNHVLDCPVALEQTCDDCGALPGEECAWSCSAYWNGTADDAQ
ncbi:hypothetical protein AB0M47_08655 [Hamadaea sp. NPDC051192]|uniref:hypothetical protein n=1 Tax=Hamadaea sp. NPDC051192 TaxID=3154940 RepID=UPI00342F0300